MKRRKKTISDIITIPNILSFIRILLIPVMIWLYIVHGKYLWTAFVLVISALTDITDGFIARRFNTVSDLGKALDPIADKLTQIFMMICLISRFRLLCVPAILLALKEIVTGAMGLAVINKTGFVPYAKWYGKLTTVVLYATIFLHTVWFDIPALYSDISVTACVIVMLLSFTLYFIQNIKALSKNIDTKSTRCGENIVCTGEENESL